MRFLAIFSQLVRVMKGLRSALPPTPFNGTGE